jgi:hypothetical protein
MLFCHSRESGNPGKIFKNSLFDTGFPTQATPERFAEASQVGNDM